MIKSDPIGLLNTGLPIAILGLLAILMPYFLVRTETQRHEQVWTTIGLTAICLFFFGAVFFGISYAVRGHGVGAALLANPVGAAWFFFRLSGMAAIVWLPVLALVWFTLAQRVERNRGAHVARIGANETTD